MKALASVNNISVKHHWKAHNLNFNFNIWNKLSFILYDELQLKHNPYFCVKHRESLLFLTATNYVL